MFKNIKHFVIDMDGVLWRGETPMPNLNAFFDTLNEYGYPFMLATNNASKTPAQYVAKLGKFGVTVTESQILTSAIATADFLQTEYEAGTAVHVSGGLGIKQAMAERGFNLISKDEVRNGAKVDLVVVGLSFDTCYDDMACAAIAINRGARFIGTNPDTSFPSEWGTLPGAGSLLALLETATGVTPITIGKPSAHMFTTALRLLNATPDNSGMIGDRLGTDIQGAKAVNMFGLLVMSGITQADELETSPLQPDFVFDDIGGIVEKIRKESDQ